jgi:hypothetical protein
MVDEIKSAGKKSPHEFLENINATIYRLNLLCNRFEKDKDVILKEGADIKKAIKALQEEIASFAKIKLDLVDRMAKNIDRTSQVIADDAGECIRNTLKINIRNSINQLEDLIDGAKKSIKFFDDWHLKRIIWMVILSIVVPIVIGVVSAKLAIPQQIIKHDAKACAAYEQACKNFGPK